jgi:hypothetical protein
LEAVLALLGGIADDIRELAQQDESQGRPKILDIQSLFDGFIPGLLSQTGQSY